MMSSHFPSTEWQRAATSLASHYFSFQFSMRVASVFCTKAKMMGIQTWFEFKYNYFYSCKLQTCLHLQSPPYSGVCKCNIHDNHFHRFCVAFSWKWWLTSVRRWWWLWTAIPPVQVTSCNIFFIIIMLYRRCSFCLATLPHPWQTILSDTSHFIKRVQSAFLPRLRSWFHVHVSHSHTQFHFISLKKSHQIRSTLSPYLSPFIENDYYFICMGKHSLLPPHAILFLIFPSFSTSNFPCANQKYTILNW